MYFQNISLLLEALIYSGALAALLYEFYITKNRPILFLAGTVTIFLFMTLLDLLLPVIERDNSFSATLFGLELELAGTVVALTFLILFFDSFHSPTILNAKNVALFVVVFSNETAVLVSYVSSINLLDLPADATISRSETSILLFLSISTIVALILIVVLTIYLFLLLRRKIKESETSQIERLFKRIRNGGVMIVFGPLILAVFFSVPLSKAGLDPSFLDSIATLTGLALIFAAVHRGGIYLLQGTNLKKLLIVSEEGIPVYGYSFHSLSKERDLDNIEGEVLFSGAFKTISLLMGEFTGSTHQVKQIILEDMAISARSLPDGKFSILLISDFVSPFTADALDSFTENIRYILEEIEPPQQLTVDQVKFTNSLVETTFGFRNLQILSSQYD